MGRVEENFTSLQAIGILIVVQLAAICFAQYKGSSPCPCRNGGLCITGRSETLLTQLCECPPGYGGKFCEAIESMCPAQLNDCAGGAVCRLVNSKKECVCPPGTLGPRCELSNLCLTQQPCRNRGICSIRLDGGAGAGANVSLTYTCRCPPGFDGDNCERDVDECEHRDHKALSACVHGRCVNTIGSFRCDCIDGYRGKTCEHRETPCDKRSRQCENNGVCQIRRNGQVYCACPLGFAGEFCDIHVVQPPHSSISIASALSTSQSMAVGSTSVALVDTTTTPNVAQKRILNNNEQVAMCSLQKCDSKNNNGRCDPECAMRMCEYDRGECSFGVIPFEQCYEKHHASINYNNRPCDQVFADGMCDLHCDSEECLFDGFDCAKVSPMEFPACSPGCALVYANNFCDYDCNTPECAWDGADCAESSALRGYVTALVGSSDSASASENNALAGAGAGAVAQNAMVRNSFLQQLSVRTNLVARARSVVEINETHTELHIAMRRTHCADPSCFENIDYASQLLIAHVVSGRAAFRDVSVLSVGAHRDVESESESESGSEARNVEYAGQGHDSRLSTVSSASTAETYKIMMYVLLFCFLCLLLTGLAIMINILWQFNRRRRRKHRASDVSRLHALHAQRADQRDESSFGLLAPNTNGCWSRSALHESDDRLCMKDFNKCAANPFAYSNDASPATSFNQDDVDFRQSEVTSFPTVPRRVHFPAARGMCNQF